MTNPLFKGLSVRLKTSGTQAINCRCWGDAIHFQGNCRRHLSVYVWFRVGKGTLGNEYERLTFILQYFDSCTNIIPFHVWLKLLPLHGVAVITYVKQWCSYSNYAAQHRSITSNKAVLITDMTVLWDIAALHIVYSCCLLTEVFCLVLEIKWRKEGKTKVLAGHLWLLAPWLV